MSLNGAFTPEIAQRGKVSTGTSVLRACQRFRSVRFARYSALEFAAAAEILLLGTVGGIDQRIPDNWATRMSKQVSRNFVSYHKSSAFLVSARRHQGRAMKMAISLSGA